MATAIPTRVFEEVDFYFSVEFECAYFDVSYEGPNLGINLLVTKNVRSYQERNFEDRMLGEMRYAACRTAHIYSAHPLSFTHLRFGRMTYHGVERGDDFGPLHHYTYSTNTL